MLLGVKKLGLVTSYNDEAQAAVVKCYVRFGFKIGLGLDRNSETKKNGFIGVVEKDNLDGMVAEVVASGIDAVTKFCTNLITA